MSVFVFLESEVKSENKGLGGWIVTYIHTQVTVGQPAVVIVAAGVDGGDFRIETSVLGDGEQVLCLHIKTKAIDSKPVDHRFRQGITQLQVAHAQVSARLNVIINRHLAANGVVAGDTGQLGIAALRGPAFVQYSSGAVALERVEVGPVPGVVSDFAT